MRNAFKVIAAFLGAAPAVAFVLAGPPLPPLATVVICGIGIASAALLLSWAVDAAQSEVSASVATAILALVAVLPEYTVDFFYAFRGGHSARFAGFAAANMNGGNRLLLGLGWPLVLVLYSARRARPNRHWRLPIEPTRRIELTVLLAATACCFLIVVTGELALYHSMILGGLFLAFMWRLARVERREPELDGAAATLAALPRARRRAALALIFAGAGAVCILAAKPFATSLVQLGRSMGIDEYLLVEWVAPISSEAPEILVASLLALRGDGDSAIGTLLSSKVNQWTLLIASLPIAYRLGGGSSALRLEDRQSVELFLTAAQTILGWSFVSRLQLRGWHAAALFGLFCLQLVFSSIDSRQRIAILYLAIAAAVLIARGVRQAPESR